MINKVAMNAYHNALQEGMRLRTQNQSQQGAGAGAAEKQGGFAEAFADSLEKVNDMQREKAAMITSFASGETQNVHELMISMQKASTTMALTSAVRSKVMTAYKEIMQTSF